MNIINMEKENLVIPAEFADICPISDKDFHNEMSILVEKPMFQQVVKFVMPNDCLLYTSPSPRDS